jgi:hypothetical protein
MGMFDTIICKYPLPLPTDAMGYVSSESFQTKDLENSLSVYEIREDGTLWEQKHETEWIDGDTNSKNWLDKIGHSESIRSWWDQVSFTNTIHLYDYQNNDDVEYDYCIEYKIVFVNGAVNEITISQFEARPNAARKIRDLKFVEKIKQTRDFRESKRYRYFYKYYNYVIHFVLGGLVNLFGCLKNNIFKLEMWLKL